ncbi:MAG: ATPase domain-containing protein, partial [Candidatus Subteraquimicrobiales bacterium]|nr:ATPase domain-containing protein [Candidatus Subteraquimicrobiales bacterium]
MNIERIKSGVSELDNIAGGGFFQGSAIQIKGAPGTGKSTLGLQFIYKGVTDYNENGLIITFEEFPEAFYRDALSFGWDLKALEGKGQLKIVFTSPAVLQEELKEPTSAISRIIRESGVKRVMVDSISHFRQITEDSQRLRRIYYSLINALKREGVTSILISEVGDLMGEPKISQTGLAFIVDTVIFLRYVEIESEIRKALVILKVRGSNHDKDVREFEVTSNGIEIKTKFSGREGIMSGAPRS